MRFIKTFNSFKEGRVSKKLYGRIDSKQYQEGLADLENMVPLQGGGLTRVFGSRVDYRHDSSNDFQHLAYGNYKNFAIDAFNIQYVLTICVSNDNSVHLYRWSPDIESYTYFNILPPGSTDIDADGFSIASIDRKTIVVHDSGLLMPLIITDGIIDSSIKALLVGSFESVHPNVAEWNAANPGSEFVYASDGVKSFPMTDLADISPLTISAVTITSGRAVHNITSSDTAIQAILTRTPFIYIEGVGKDPDKRSFIASFYGLRGDAVTNGRKFSTNWIFSDFVSGTFDQSHLSAGGVTSSSRWSHSMWYTNNWPKYVTSFESRLVFAGTPTHPKAIFLSAVGSYTDFWQFRYPDTGLATVPAARPNGSIVETDPCIFFSSDFDEKKITGIAGGEVLTLTSDTSASVMSGGDTILSPFSLQMRTIMNQGGASGKLRFFQGAAVFISYDRKRLHGFNYVQVNGEKQDFELSVLFSDLVEGRTILDIQVDNPRNILWVLISNGPLIAITKLPDSWAVSTMCHYEGISTIAVVSKLHDNPNIYTPDVTGNCLIATTFYANGPQFSLSIHPMFALQSDAVTRTIAQATYGQFLSRRTRLMYDDTDESWHFGGFSTAYAAQFTDANVVPIVQSLYNPTFYPFHGLLYIWKEGTDEYATISAEDLVELDVHTTPGAPYYKFVWEHSPIVDEDVFHIGYADPALFSTTPVEAGQQWGTAQMGIKNIDTIGIRHYKTLSYEVSSKGTQWQERVVADNEGVSTDGRAEIKFSASPDYDHQVRIRNTKPEPLTILSLTLRGNSNDG